MACGPWMHTGAMAGTRGEGPGGASASHHRRLPRAQTQPHRVLPVSAAELGVQTPPAPTI